MKYEIKNSDDGQFYFTLHSRNGEIITTSELYTQKHSCYDGIYSVMSVATIAPIIDLTKESS